MSNSYGFVVGQKVKLKDGRTVKITALSSPFKGVMRGKSKGKSVLFDVSQLMEEL